MAFRKITANKGLLKSFHCDNANSTPGKTAPTEGLPDQGARFGLLGRPERAPEAYPTFLERIQTASFSQTILFI